MEMNLYELMKSKFTAKLIESHLGLLFLIFGLKIVFFDYFEVIIIRKWFFETKQKGNF